MTQHLRVFLLCLAVCFSLIAAPIYQGGTGSIVYGVAPHGGPPVANSTYIPNNFNGLTDILPAPEAAT